LTEAQFIRADSTLTLALTDKLWSVVVPAGATLNQTAFQDALAVLAAVRTEKFVNYVSSDLAAYSLDKPQAIVRLTSPSGVTALSIGAAAQSGYYYATSTTVDGVFLLTPADLVTLFAPEQLLQSLGVGSTIGAPEEGSQVDDIQ